MGFPAFDAQPTRTFLMKSAVLQARWAAKTGGRLNPVASPTFPANTVPRVPRSASRGTARFLATRHGLAIFTCMPTVSSLPTHHY
jgi:hypothetical protein